jgi:uncharacterized protein (TIGR00369 family)
MNKQPNSSMCFACGLENRAGLRLTFYDDGAGRVISEFTIGPDHQGYPGVVHGGVVAAILDEVGGRTVMIDDHNRFFMTARLEIKYRQPVPTETPLKAVGWLVKQRERAVTAHAEIRALDDAVLAEAELLLADMPAAAFNPSEADRLGWRVYDD